MLFLPGIIPSSVYSNFPLLCVMAAKQNKNSDRKTKNQKQANKNNEQKNKMKHVFFPHGTLAPFRAERHHQKKLKNYRWA